MTENLRLRLRRRTEPPPPDELWYEVVDIHTGAVVETASDYAYLDTSLFELTEILDMTVAILERGYLPLDDDDRTLADEVRATCQRWRDRAAAIMARHLPSGEPNTGG